MSIFVQEGKLATLFRFLKYLLILLIFLGIYSGGTLPAHASPALETSVSETPVTIYYSRACGHCHIYVEEVVEEVLKQVGFENITIKDFIYDQKARQELVELTQKLGIPTELRGHLAIFIGDSIILEGHVPIPVIADLLRLGEKRPFERIVVLQDEMHGPKSYKVWAFRGEIKEYPLDTPISQYLDWLQENFPSVKGSVLSVAQVGQAQLLFPAVLAAGFLDGLNPCAFAVLLFFIAFLFTLSRTRLTILKMGGTYILAIYFTYLLIGLGILKTFLTFGPPHLIARIGAVLVILLGLINLKDYFFPYFPLFPVTLRIPASAQERIGSLAQRATLPSSLALGVLVGLCTFPCSGGIYVAVIGLLASQKSYLQGLGYLLAYNVMFILPLIAILALASNKVVTTKLHQWQQSKTRPMRLVYGLVMIGVGVLILLWL